MMTVAPQVLRFNLWLTLISLLVLTAAFFGGMWSLWQSFMPFALSIWGAAAWYSSPAPLPRSLKFAVIPPVLLVLAWSLVQTLPLIGFTSPVYTLISPSLWPAISLNIHATLTQAAYGASLLLMSCGVYALTRQNLNSSLPIKGIALTTLAVAVYGVIIFAAGNNSVVWIGKTAYLESLTASFINHNHYATFAGIGVLACLALFFERAGEISSRLNWRQRLSAMWVLIVQPRWPWLVGSLFLFITVVLSTSRAGLAATSFGILVLFAALAYARRALRLHFIGFMAIAVVLGLMLVEITGTATASRLTNVDKDLIGRSTIYALTQNAIATEPYSGQGFGAFEDIFSLERGKPEALGIKGSIDHAHNTYLELAAELGLPAAALLGIALLTVLTLLLKGLSARRRGVTWPALGVATIALTGGHAFADFSLSMPAVATVTLFIVAFAVAQSFPEEASPTKKWSFALLLLPLLGLLIAPFSLWQAWADFPSARAARNVRLLDRGFSPDQIPFQLAKARANLLRATQRNPYNPNYLYNIARVETALSQALPELARPALRAQASIHYLESLRLAPVNGGAWYRLAWLENTRQNYSGAQYYMGNSILTNAFDAHFLFARTYLMLTLYPHAVPDNQDLFARHLRYLWPTHNGLIIDVIKKDRAAFEQMRQILATNPLMFEASWQRATNRPLVPLGEAATPR